jgi:hypothetical protein
VDPRQVYEPRSQLVRTLERWRGGAHWTAVVVVGDLDPGGAYELRAKANALRSTTADPVDQLRIAGEALDQIGRETDHVVVVTGGAEPTVSALPRLLLELSDPTVPAVTSAELSCDGLPLIAGYRLESLRGALAVAQAFDPASPTSVIGILHPVTLRLQFHERNDLDTA